MTLDISSRYKEQCEKGFIKISIEFSHGKKINSVPISVTYRQTDFFYTALHFRDIQSVQKCILNDSKIQVVSNLWTKL